MRVPLAMTLLTLHAGCGGAPSVDVPSDVSSSPPSRADEQVVVGKRVHSTHFSIAVAEFPDSPERSDGFYTAAIRPEGVKILWKALIRDLAKYDPDNVHLERLATFAVDVENGPETASRAEGNTIIISEGHVRAGSLLAYAHARLATNPELHKAFNQWFDMMIDALVYGEGVIAIDDKQFSVQKALSSGNPERNEFTAMYEETMFSWVWWLQAHEAAHILLEHERHAVAQSPDDHSASSRDLEVEADNLALELLVEARKFNPHAFGCWCGWQIIQYAVLNARIDVDAAASSMTHPSPTDRINSALEKLQELNQIGADDRELIEKMCAELLIKYERAIREGQLDKLFPMRNRPADVSVQSERAFKRISKLAILSGALREQAD